MLYKYIVAAIEWILASKARAAIASFAMILIVLVGVAGILIYSIMTPGWTIKFAGFALGAIIVAGTTIALDEIKRRITE